MEFTGTCKLEEKDEVTNTCMDDEGYGKKLYSLTLTMNDARCSVIGYAFEDADHERFKNLLPNHDYTYFMSEKCFVLGPFITKNHMFYNLDKRQ